MRRSRVLALLCFTLGTGVAGAQTPDLTPEQNSAESIMKPGYLCSLEDSKRLIQIVYLVPGQEVPCEVHYHKDGEQKLLWRAVNQAGFCERKADDLADQQQEWGFSCQTLTDTSVALD